MWALPFAFCGWFLKNFRCFAQWKAWLRGLDARAVGEGGGPSAPARMVKTVSLSLCRLQDEQCQRGIHAVVELEEDSRHGRGADRLPQAEGCKCSAGNGVLVRVHPPAPQSSRAECDVFPKGAKWAAEALESLAPLLGEETEHKGSILSLSKVKIVTVEKKVNEILNRLEKTKLERFPDLAAEKEGRDREERNEKKAQIQEMKRREKEEMKKKREMDELRYVGAVAPGGLRVFPADLIMCSPPRVSSVHGGAVTTSEP